MRIYTRSGDQGETGLLGGTRVRKDNLLLEAYGSLDELCSHLGFARSLAADAELAATLDEVQSLLFEMGAELASAGKQTRVEARHVVRLEALIDHYSEQLPPLRAFIKPGGAPCAAALHVARTVARRAERRVVASTEVAPVSPHMLGCANRLSDLLFVLARLANFKAGIVESEWRPGQ